MYGHILFENKQTNKKSKVNIKKYHEYPVSKQFTHFFSEIPKERSKSARFKKGYRKAGPNEGLSEKSSSSYLS